MLIALPPPLLSSDSSSPPHVFPLFAECLDKAASHGVLHAHRFALCCPTEALVAARRDLGCSSVCLWASTETGRALFLCAFVCLPRSDVPCVFSMLYGSVDAHTLLGAAHTEEDACTEPAASILGKFSRLECVALQALPFCLHPGCGTVRLCRGVHPGNALLHKFKVQQSHTVSSPSQIFYCRPLVLVQGKSTLSFPPRHHEGSS
eukprot:scaffold45905_cov15-Tisochrysis_lutea.AAC.2